MEEYLVLSEYGEDNNLFVVLAKDAKDAINQVWESNIVALNESMKKINEECGKTVCKLCTKEELHAKSFGSLHNSEGKVLLVN